MKKTTFFFIGLFLVVAAPCHAQFLQNSPIVKAQLKNTNSSYNKIIQSSATRNGNGLIRVSFSVENDFIDGTFAIYKSSDFMNPVLIDVISYTATKLKNHTVNFMCFDTTLDLSFNMCHIVKIDKNSSIFASYGNQITKSVVDMKIESAF